MHDQARAQGSTLYVWGKTSLDTRDGSVVLALMPMIRLSKTIYAVRRPMSGLVRTCDSWPGHVALTGNAMVADYGVAEPANTRDFFLRVLRMECQ